jgi:hypothetical protein
MPKRSFGMNSRIAPIYNRSIQNGIMDFEALNKMYDEKIAKDKLNAKLKRDAKRRLIGGLAKTGLGLALSYATGGAMLPVAIKGGVETLRNGVGVIETSRRPAAKLGDETPIEEDPQYAPAEPESTGSFAGRFARNYLSALNPLNVFSVITSGGSKAALKKAQESHEFAPEPDTLLNAIGKKTGGAASLLPSAMTITGLLRDKKKEGGDEAVQNALDHIGLGGDSGADRFFNKGARQTIEQGHVYRKGEEVPKSKEDVVADLIEKYAKETGLDKQVRYPGLAQPSRAEQIKKYAQHIIPILGKAGMGYLEGQDQQAIGGDKSLPWQTALAMGLDEVGTQLHKRASDEKYAKMLRAIDSGNIDYVLEQAKDDPKLIAKAYAKKAEMEKEAARKEKEEMLSSIKLRTEKDKKERQNKKDSQFDKKFELSIQKLEQSLLPKQKVEKMSYAIPGITQREYAERLSTAKTMKLKGDALQAFLRNPKSIEAFEEVKESYNPFNHAKTWRKKDGYVMDKDGNVIRVRKR